MLLWLLLSFLLLSLVLPQLHSAGIASLHLKTPCKLVQACCRDITCNGLFGILAVHEYSAVYRGIHSLRGMLVLLMATSLRAEQRH